ncbi:MAG: matrixin family metalloprotease, partial [Planctomycetaceae bacterium]
AIGLVPGQTFGTISAPWYESADEPVVVKYDFRDQNGFANLISAEQVARTIDALNAWSDATGGQLIFVRDQEADLAHIVNFGTGDLRAFQLNSATGGTLGVAGGQLTQDDAGDFRVTGAAWLDVAEYWDTEIGNGNPAGTYDYFTVMAHEIGHTLGYGDSRNPGSRDIMSGIYDAERSRDTITHAAQTGLFYRGVEAGDPRTDFAVLPLTTAEAQLTAAEVRTLLDKASAVTASEDGIFAVVDRNGRILGVRVESQVLATITDQATLVFAIDGAVAKARTAAFFGSGDATIGSSGAPLTPRTIQYISQSTVTQREVEGNPNADNSSAAAAAASTTRGPGFVAPIGLGGHFPAGIMHTPPVDLCHIEHTNRDS